MLSPRSDAAILAAIFQVIDNSIELIGLILIPILAFTKSHKLSSLAAYLWPDRSKPEKELRELFINSLLEKSAFQSDDESRCQ